jgi:hypothetical protein
MHRGPDRLHALAYPEPLPISPDGPLHDQAVQYRDELQTRGANIVEFGVSSETNPDVTSRSLIMNNVIDAVGTEDDRLNPHMFGALATGVEDNMPVIDQRINGGWEPSGNTYRLDEAAVGRFRSTESFLSELMDNESSRDRVRGATIDYVNDQLGVIHREAGDAGPNSEFDRNEMHDLGRILGVATEAEIDSIERAYQRDKDEAALWGRIVDYGAGWVPGVG